MKNLQFNIKMPLVLCLCFISYFGIAQGNVTVLIQGENIAKTIHLDVFHSYQVELQKGQFAMLNLNQKGLDMKVVTYSPAGEKLDEFDSTNGINGPELVVLDGLESGAYRIEAHPLAENKKVKQGVYEIELLSIVESGKEQLEKIIEFSNSGNLPGFSVGIVNQNGIQFQKAYGYADVQKKEPYKVSTIHNVGSTTKTLIGLAIMKLVEQGKLSLETPVNDILPFQVINPYYPNIPITLKHLANHTSTIKETKDYERSYVLTEQSNLDKSTYHKSDYEDFKLYGKNKDMPMAQFLRNIVSKDGAWYRKKNFHKQKPGIDYHYSNAAATLAAHIVELVSGEKFSVYVKKNILQPFDMKTAGLQIADVDMTAHAKHYGLNGNPLPNYTLITYPDGGMMASISDLSIYLVELIKGYNGNSKFLTEASFKEMMRDHQLETESEKYGVFWELMNSGMMGHNGGDPGAMSMMYFNPETNIGVTYISNIIPALAGPGVDFRNVWKGLNRYAKYFK